MKEDNINLYICHTYYHVLISIIKQLKSDTKSDIILSANVMDNFLTNNSILVKKLIESKIFNDVIIFDYSKIEKKYVKHFLYINRIWLGNKIIRRKEYDFKKYKRIYIFNDRTLVGYLINKEKIFYNLLEDGTDCFKSSHKTFFNNKDFNIKKYIKKKLKIYEVAESPMIASIEVNHKKDLFINNHNIIEQSKEKLISCLNSQEKEKILKIFIDNLQEIIVPIGSSLILTQPLYEDNLLKNEEEKVNLYKKIIKKYTSGEKIVLKTHPRETTDYFKYFKEEKNIVIIEEKFPIEVLNFLDIKFKRVISVASTAINLIKNADEWIEIGYDKMESI